jgi:drug/metabolite transporter (DMT)-like permease
MKLRWILLFFAIGVAWGSLWLVTGGPVHAVPLLCAGCLRFTASAAILWLAALVSRLFRRPSAPGHAHAVSASAILGFALLALPYLCSAWGSGAVRPHLQTPPPGFPAGVYAAMPMAVLLMSGEDAAAIPPRLLLGLIGVVLLVAQGIGVNAASWPAELLVIAGMLSNSYALVYAKRHEETSSLLRSCAAQFTVAAAVLGLAALPSGEWSRLAANHSAVAPSVWGGLLIAAFVSAITLPAMYLLLSRAGDVTTASLQWLVALTGVAEAAWFLRAGTLWVTRAGALVTLAALVWTWLARTPPGESHRLLSEQ